MNITKLASVSLFALILGGCSVHPKPFTESEDIARAVSDHKTVKNNLTVVTGKLSLPRAVALALANNYDIEMSRLEVSQSDKQLDLAWRAMLPQITAGSGFDQRSNYNSAASRSQQTGIQSLESSYSEQRDHGTGYGNFEWNVLDVGISYVNALEQANKEMIARERSRRAYNNIIRKTQNDYWRASVAERVLPHLQGMIDQAEAMIVASKSAMDQHLQDPTILMDEQQALLQEIRQLQKAKIDLASAQLDLATDIHAAQGSSYTLSSSLSDFTPVSFNGLMPQLETLALAKRSDIRTEAYQQRIDREEIDKAIIKMMPGIGAIGNGNFDSNSLLYHNLWAQIGIHATYNIMSLVNGPATISLAKGDVKISELRRINLGIAAISQLNLAVAQYQLNADNLKTTKHLYEVGRQMTDVAEKTNRAGLESRSDSIRYQSLAMITDITYNTALAQLQSDLANIYAETGVDLVPVDTNLSNIDALTKVVDASLNRWQHGLLPAIPVSLAGTPAPVQAKTPQQVSTVWSQRLTEQDNQYKGLR